MFKIHCGIPNAYILETTMYKYKFLVYNWNSLLPKCYMLRLAAVCHIHVALFVLSMFCSSFVYDSHVALICIYDVLSMFWDVV